MRIGPTVLVVAFAVITLAAAPAPCQNRTIVLAGGATLEVAIADIKGGYLFVTFPDGNSQAFLLEDVDLEASGLTPVTSERTVNPGPGSIADARSDSESPSRITLSDADVNHVRPARRTEAAAGEEDAAAQGPQPAALLVSDLDQQISGGILTLTGRVRNSGGQPVTSVALQAQAVDSLGNVAGTGSTQIPDEIGPGQVVSFTINFPILGRVTDVKVSARAAMANFDFQPPAEDAAE